LLAAVPAGERALWVPKIGFRMQTSQFRRRSGVGTHTVSPSPTIPWIVTRTPAGCFPQLFHKGRVTSALRINARSAVQREPGAVSGRAARPVRPVDGRWGRGPSLGGWFGSGRAHDRPGRDRSGARPAAAPKPGEGADRQAESNLRAVHARESRGRVCEPTRGTSRQCARVQTQRSCGSSVSIIFRRTIWLHHIARSLRVIWATRGRRPSST